MKKRSIQLTLIYSGLLLTGLIYAFGVVRWDWSIPCLFNELTGWQCPGCGVTRMCLALLHADFINAFRWNPLLFGTLPVLAYLIGYLSYRYIRYGDCQLKKWQECLCWVLVAVFVLYGLLRNMLEL